MNSYYLYQRQYRETGGAWKNTSIYSVDGWQTQEKVVAQIDPSECNEWNPDEGCKVTLTLEDCTEVCIPCDGSRTVTRADLGEYANRAIIAEFGCCIDTIDGVFQGDTKIQKVIIPECITSITEASFYGTNIEGLVIPASVTYIGNQVCNLANIEWIRFLGTVPPTLAAQGALNGTYPIYVPPAYVNAYKTASIWHYYSARIQPWQGQVETDYPIECDTPGPDTGDTGTTYETWIEDGTGYTCSGTTKYHVEYKWTSATGDDGSYIKTNVLRRGNLWETYSTDCGYEPPVGIKYLIRNNDNTIFSASCSSNSAVTSSIVHSNSSMPLKVRSAEVYPCVSTIGGKFLSGCTFLSSITMTNHVVNIGDYAFADCANLSSITLSTNLTYLGDYALYGCDELSSITIPNGVTILNEGVFMSDEKLKTVNLPNTLEEIHWYAFSGCNSIESIVIPESVELIDNKSFWGCSSLTSVTLPTTLNNNALIADGLFSYCSSLPSVTLPTNIWSIGEEAFIYCTSLTSVTIPSGVTIINQYAFYNCSSLQYIRMLPTTPPNLDRGNCFDNTNNCPIYVPASAYQDYIDEVNVTNSYWKKYGSRIQIWPG